MLSPPELSVNTVSSNDDCLRSLCPSVPCRFDRQMFVFVFCCFLFMNLLRQLYKNLSISWYTAWCC
jgi:hypothetical protein